MEEHPFTEPFVAIDNVTYAKFHPNDRHATEPTSVVVFAILSLLIIISAFAELTLLVSLCTTASTNLHNHMFSSITRATMNFLNKNPSGRY